MKGRNDPRDRLSIQISKLKEELERRSEATASKNEVLNLLLADVGVAKNEVLRAETADTEVRAYLEKKWQELAKL